MTKLLFLGSGSAFTIGNYNFQSNMFLINDRGDKLLIDCGSDIRFSLNLAGFTYNDVTDIYISHLHADHIGGLEYIGYNTFFNPQCPKPNLYLSKEIAAPLWEKSLSGGMQYIEGDIADLETFFNVHKIGKDRTFSWEKITFELIKILHVNTQYLVMPTYGLFFETDQVKVFLTTDTQFSPELLESQYNQADIIFQDCEIYPYPSPVHAQYKDLVTLPENLKKKMWLYGYQPGELPDAKKDGFLGFVKRGDIFNFAEL